MEKVMVNDNITDLIIETLKLEGRDKYVVQHLLNGGKQRDCTWEGKELNPNTVSTIRSKYIPFVQFERNGVSIVDVNAPAWLKSSELYVPQQLTEPVKQVVKRQKRSVETITLNEHTAIVSELKETMKKAYENAIIESNAQTVTQVLKEAEELRTVELSKLNVKHKEQQAELKETLRVKYMKEAADLFQRQIDAAKSASEGATAALQSAKQEIDDLNKLLSSETISKSELKTKNNELVFKVSDYENQVEELKYEIERLRPKIDRAFVLQSLVSCGWLLGLVALSVFSIENMLIYFNAGSFWIVAVILGVFIEFMLWATNITRFAGSLDDVDSEYTSQELALVIFFFRAFANSLGGYYIATNAKEFAQAGGLYANISTKFTDINELYFGWEVGGAGMILTAIIIGAFVAYMEYKALPLAIRHAYNLFIKKVQ